MSVKEWIRKFLLGPSCVKLINYDARTATIKSISGDIPGADGISIGEFNIARDKVRDASEMAEALDDYQKLMCEIERNLNDEAEKKKYRMLRIATIGLLTSARATLAAFKLDSNDESNLNDIVDRLKNFSLLIGRSALSDIGVNESKIEEYLKKGEAPKLESNVIPKAFEIAKITNDEAQEIAG